MGTVSGILAEARKHRGYREVNLKSKFGIWYGDQVKSAAFDTAPWCDAWVSYIATVTDNLAAVCPGGIRAYTVYHADDFRDRGRWHPDIAGIRAGDIVFFDWGYTNSIGNIDHVGIVEKVLSGGRIQTIEGNTDNMCARRIRTASTIAGYGRPAYTGTTAQEDDDVSAKDVWEYPIDTGDGGKKWLAQSVLGNLEKDQDATNEMLKQVLTALSALDAKLTALEARGPASPAEVSQRVDEAINAAVVRLSTSPRKAA